VSLVRVKMSSELHRKFRRWAFDNSTTMQSALVGAAESMCNGKTVTVHHETTAIKPKITETLGECQLCGKTGVKTALNRDKKWVCYECAGVK